MKRLFAYLVIAVLAVVIALLMHQADPGLVLVRTGAYQLETSFNMVVVIGIILLLAGFLVYRLLNTLISMPHNAEAYRSQRKLERSTDELQQAMRLLLEGRYGQAQLRAEEMFEHQQLPVISALIAAVAARQLRSVEKVTLWAERALHINRQLGATTLMLRAETALAAQDYQEARELLNVLQKKHGLHLAALRLELRAVTGCADWRSVLRLSRKLEKRGGMPAVEAEAVKQRAHSQIIRREISSAAEMSSYVASIPKNERLPALILAVARMLHEKDFGIAAEPIYVTLINYLTDDEDAAMTRSQIYYYYGKLAGGEIAHRIAAAELWLKRDPLDGQLLQCLGKLCFQQQLWGKARYYFEESLRQLPSHETHWALATLFDHTGEPNLAIEHYRLAASV